MTGVQTCALPIFEAIHPSAFDDVHEVLRSREIRGLLADGERGGFRFARQNAELHLHGGVKRDVRRVFL